MKINGKELHIYLSLVWMFDKKWMKWKVTLFKCWIEMNHFITILLYHLFFNRDMNVLWRKKKEYFGDFNKKIIKANPVFSNYYS